MRVRTAAPLAAAALLAGSAVHANAAAPKPKPKPITKTYSVTGVPFPAPPTGPSCSLSPQGVGTTRETITVKGPGKLVAEVTGFTGDWDMALLSNSGTMLVQGAGADAGNTDAAPKESLVYKAKKAQTFFLDVCNFAGTPQATVKYVFTYS
jgi:hypothetical protein